MNFVPISFDVQRSDQTEESAQAYSKQIIQFEDALSQDQKLKILERDNYTCQCCGFESKKYQKIHFKNGNYEDHDPDNLITTCIYCHQCFHMDMIGDMKSGCLVWLPEISQEKLHHIMRSIYVARIAQGEIAETAKKLLDILMKRRESAKVRLGTDDPMVLSTVLKDYIEQRHYGARMKKLDGIRIMPLDRRIVKEGELEFNQFPQILAFWRSKDGPFGNALPKTWLEHYKNIFTEQEAA